MGATNDIANYVASGSYQNIPSSALGFAKLLFMDTLGVAVAGSNLPAANIAHDYAIKLGSNSVEKAHVVGKKLTLAPSFAALANGVSAHTLDYDDTSFLTVAHSSGSAVPVLLALAEELNSSGQDVIEAFVYAHEGLARLALAIMPTHYLHGWHTTGTLSTLSSALAAAKLMKFNAEQIASTLGVASSMSGGMRGNFGTFTKALHTGMAALHGMMSANLVRSGFTGNQEILEHRYGFWSLMAGADNVNPSLTEEAVKNVERFYLDDPGVGIKLHPCNSAVLAGIGTAIKLSIENNIDPDEVDHIDYGYMHVARGIVPFDDPKNSPEAQYSMTHAIAASVVKRNAGIEEFSEAGVADPKIAAMRKKVKPYEHAEFLKFSDPHDVPACVVSIHMKNGAVFTDSLRRPKAYPGGEAVAKSEVVDKFKVNIESVLEGKSAKAFELADNIDSLTNLSELIDSLTS